ncbi:DUF4238 domain-containing protein [Yersinia ruckeri]|uniref:DUF4238 domain-containing protein n=1 Tax=Yersinia ruckeri TaxID=29486 RepID=UPI0011AA4D33|nr:DUF4238 domain-containing protein [Yersinia ruckeri]
MSYSWRNIYLVFVVEFYGVFGVSNKQVKKNQHYVPQSYLRRFTIDGEKSLIWSFDKKANKFLKNTSSINKICCEDYYYYQLDEKGDVNHTKLEDVISEIEKIGNDILNEIIGMSSMPYISLQLEKKGHLAFYIGLMLTRGPAFRDGIHEMYGMLAKSGLRQAYESGKLDSIPATLKPLIDNKGLEAAIQVSVHKIVSLEPMVNAARGIALSLLQKRWTLWVAAEGSKFITSDVPVIFQSKVNGYGGPSHPATELIFPISNKFCLVISPFSREEPIIFIQACSNFQVLDINKRILGAANNFVFCSEQHEWLLNLDEKEIGKGQKIVSGIERKGFNVIGNPFKK